MALLSDAPSPAIEARLLDQTIEVVQNRRGHLRVPLDRHDERLVGLLERLDHPVAGRRHHAQALGDPIDMTP